MHLNTKALAFYMNRLNLYMYWKLFYIFLCVEKMGYSMTETWSQEVNSTLCKKNGV